MLLFSKDRIILYSKKVTYIVKRLKSRTMVENGEKHYFALVWTTAIV